MEVILLERVEKLGQLGDVVQVKDGYARNYLLPQKKALRATEEAHAHFEAERAKIEKENESARDGAVTLAEGMSGLNVVIVQQAGESGQLYGSVTARDIAAAVSAAGYPVERRQVVLQSVIKSLGLYRAEVRLHAEVPVDVTVNVARSEEEAKLQASGAEVTSETEDEGAQAVDVEEIFEQVPPKESLAVETLESSDAEGVSVNGSDTVSTSQSNVAADNS